MSGGLLVAGLVVPVPGMRVHNPLDTPWSKLEPGDYRMRRTSWVSHAIVHTTKGIWPQRLIPGSMPGGKDQVVADFYRKDPQHNGAHAVADIDGTGACLADLATQAAYHATTSNDRSWGLEVYQLADGGLTEAGIDGALRMLFAGCDALGIPRQVHRAPYRGRPIARLVAGGADCVGIFGHRDQTDRRGRGDPGDMIMAEIAGDQSVEAFDFDRREDLSVWMRRQQYLVNIGERLTVDGVCGPSTMASLRRRGFANGRAVDAALGS